MKVNESYKFSEINCIPNVFYTCFAKEIILKQLFALGSVIMVNIHLDFVSVNIRQ